MSAIASVAEHSIFRQLETGRPNDKDSMQLKKFSCKIQTKLNEEVFGKLELKSNLYKQSIPLTTKYILSIVQHSIY